MVMVGTVWHWQDVMAGPGPQHTPQQQQSPTPRALCITYQWYL